MYYGSIYHGDIIGAFTRAVPDCYVRDYSDVNGYITVCRGYKTIKWKGGSVTTPEYRSVPDKTLLNLPRGQVTALTRYVGLKLDRPGWRQEFRRAARYLSDSQMRAITKRLNVGEVFRGIV